MNATDTLARPTNPNADAAVDYGRTVAAAAAQGMYRRVELADNAQVNAILSPRYYAYVIDQSGTLRRPDIPA